ncbi:MAG: hypothetical protein ACLTZH_00920, partial [Subdoligranulum sp.]
SSAVCACEKAAREDPQILPGGFAIYFSFYLRWVRQFSAITTSTREADDQQDTGHADEHTVKKSGPGIAAFIRSGIG